MRNNIIIVLMLLGLTFLGTSVVLADLAWSPATLVETGTTTASSPKIAVDPNGNIMAVWVQWDMNDTDQTIYANRYVVGSGWGSPTLLETSTMPVGGPQIAVDSNGNAIAVWEQAWKTANGTRYGIYANRYVAGTGWGAATNLSGDAVQIANSAEVALDSIGNAAVVWVQGFSSDRSIYADRYTVGTGWSTPVHIGTSPADYSEAPQIAFDPNGNAIAVWNQYGGKVYANRYVAGTGWGTTDIVDSGGQNYSEKIAFDPDGNAIAVWGKYESNSYNIWASRYVVGTGWGAESIVNTTLGDAGDPQIVIDKNGNATVVWVQYGSIYASNGSLASRLGQMAIFQRLLYNIL